VRPVFHHVQNQPPCLRLPLVIPALPPRVQACRRADESAKACFDELSTGLKEKLAKLESEMQRLAAMEKLMLASPD
jgi:hypothetical protein